jgi:putative Holliday junction resolvase
LNIGSSDIIPNMGVILGIDVGRVRVGLAVADETGSFVTPIGTFPRSKGRAEDVVRAEIEARRVEFVLVGLPLMEDGSRSEQCLDVESFCRRLGKRISVPIKFVDEHLTSEAAKDRIALVKGNYIPDRDRELLDAYAAVIIVEDYINLNRR